MRKLAERVGAGTMSLYTHVANKDDLLQAMVELVAEDIELPTTCGSWQASIRHSASSAHEVLLNHPWAATEWTNVMPGPTRLRLMDGILATLVAGGLDDGLVYRGYHAITMHIVGFTMQELSYRNIGGEQGLEALARNFLSGIDDDLPHLADHVRAHLNAGDHGDEFVFVLDLILDGLERTRA